MDTNSSNNALLNPDNSLSPQESDEEACVKLWGVYAKEAQSYDKGLVESWKADMDATLVFSGLYSAILTAFLIESYKNLKEDYTETTTVLLRHISTQLATSTDLRNATGPPQPATSFSPPGNALACNVFWFISLTLSLFCAFLATLVQQWARQFLQRISVVRSPKRQAQLLLFFYYGFKDFKMHHVVTVIPTLLLLSLFFFFAGLVAFLKDVNYVLTALMSLALFLIILMYLVITFIPLVKFNSPYRTPLSPLAWRFLQWVQHFFSRDVETRLWVSRTIGVLQGIQRFFCRSVKTMLWVSRRITRSFISRRLPYNNPAIILHAEPQPLRAMQLHQTAQTNEASHNNLMDRTMTASSVPDLARSRQSIQWTLRSLSDDNELLPFVEALADALQGPSGLRLNNFPLVQPLLVTADPQLDIISRISSLMLNCQNPWFKNEHRERCRIVCPRVFCILAWAILKGPDDLFSPPTRIDQVTQRRSWLSLDILTALDHGITNVALDQHHAISAVALTYLTISLAVEAMIEDSARTNLNYDQLKAILELLGPHRPQSIQLPDEEANHNSSQPVASSELQDILSSLSESRAREGLEYIRKSITCFPCDFLRVVPEFGKLSILSAHDLHGPLSLINDKLSQTIESSREEMETKGKGVVRSLTELDSIFETLFDNCDGPNRPLVAQYLAQRVGFMGFTTTSSIFRGHEDRRRRFWRLMNDFPKNAGSEWFIALQEFILCSTSVDQLDQSQAEFDRFCSDTLLSLKIGPPSADRTRLSFVIKLLALSTLLNSEKIIMPYTIACLRPDIVYDSKLSHLVQDSHIFLEMSSHSPVNHQFYTERILTATTGIDSSMVANLGNWELSGEIKSARSINALFLEGTDLVDGTYKVTGSIVAGQDIYVHGDFYISGAVSLIGDLTVVGNCSVAATGNLSIGGNLFTKGIPEMQGSTNVNGDVRSSKDICIQGDLTVKGSLQTDGCIEIFDGGKVDVGNDLSVFRDVKNDGSLNIGYLNRPGGLHHIGRSLSVSGTFHAGGQLHVDGDVHASGTVEARGDVIIVGRCQALFSSFTIGGHAVFCTQPNGIQGSTFAAGRDDVICDDILASEISCPILLVQLLRELDPVDYPREARDALEYFYQVGLHKPVSKNNRFWTRLAFSPPCAFDLARQTERFCALLMKNIDSEILDIVKMIWKLFAITLTFLEPTCHAYTEEGIWWAHPLINAARVLLSPDIFGQIKEAEKSRWNQRKKEAYIPVDYGFSLVNLAEEVMNLVERALQSAKEPHMIPLPEPTDDESP